jgi:hypothetical protein
VGFLTNYDDILIVRGKGIGIRGKEKDVIICWVVRD